VKTLILSDFHFGIPASRLSALLDSIRRLASEYDRVILNGDTLDRYEAPHCTAKSEALLKDVIEACQSRFGPPEMIMGNHDPAISKLQWVYLEPSATLVFHGDCIADITHPTKTSEQALAARLRKRWAQLGGRPKGFVELCDAYRKTQAQYLREHPMAREPRGKLAYLASVVMPPQRPLHILRYWWRAPRLAAHLAAAFPRPVRHVLVGHTHSPGEWKVNGITVLNTGSFMPMSIPYAASIEGERIFFRPLEPLLRSTRSYSFPAERFQPNVPSR